MREFIKHILSLSITAPVVGLLIVIVAFINSPPWRLVLWAFLACIIAVFTWLATGPAKRLWAVFFLFAITASCFGFIQRNNPRFFAKLGHNAARANSPQAVPCASADRFGTDAQGKRVALMFLWHATDASQFECFDMEGWHPTRGTKLLEITDELAAKLDAWLEAQRPTPTPTPMPEPEPTLEATPPVEPAISEPQPTPTPMPEVPLPPREAPTPSDEIQSWATPRPRATSTPTATPEPEPTPAPTATPVLGKTIPAGTTLTLRIWQNIDLQDVLPRHESPIQTRLASSVRDAQGNQVLSSGHALEISSRSYRQIREHVVRVWFGVHDTLNRSNTREMVLFVPTDPSHYIDVEFKKKRNIARSIVSILRGPQGRALNPQYELILKKDTTISFRLSRDWLIEERE